MEVIKQSYLLVQKEKKFVVLKIVSEKPFLEIYSKKAHAANAPANFDILYDLRKCSYVNTKIPPGPTDFFEFVLVLDNQTIVFAAKTWSLRDSWVSVLKQKLLELKIISPRENIYTKPPEMKPVNLQSRRDPRDPLPSAPPILAEIPGLEVDVTEVIENVEEVQENLQIDSLTLCDDDSIRIPVFNFSTSNTTSQNLINLLSNPLRHTQSATAHFFNDSFESNEVEEIEIENSGNNPPISLHVDYVTESEPVSDNITVIKIAESETLDRSNVIQQVTKIKIELDYEKLENPSGGSNSAVSRDSPRVNLQNIHQSPSIPVEEVKKVEESPRKLPPTPSQNKRKLSLREKQVLQLKHEINTEIRFKLRKKDCLDSIAFVSVYNQIWIAGFKPNPLLYCLHVGDQLLAVNNIVIKSPADAQKYIKMCSGLFVEISIRRLPLASIFLVKRDFEGQCTGIIRDGNTPIIVEIIPNSISSHIPPRPNEDSTWVITQINFRNISIISQKRFDETELLLNSSMEFNLLLQPSDFIDKLKKELKNIKNYRDYSLQ